jgi:excisionase family DNA binding protein
MGEGRVEEELLTVRQAADEKEVSWQAVYQAIKEGRLPKVAIGKVTLIRRVDLDAWQPRKPKKRLEPPEDR